MSWSWAGVTLFTASVPFWGVSPQTNLMYASPAWKGQLSQPKFTFPKPSVPPSHSGRGREVEHGPAGRTGSSHPSILETSLKTQTAVGRGLIPALDPIPGHLCIALHFLIAQIFFFSLLCRCWALALIILRNLGILAWADVLRPSSPSFPSLQLLAHSSSAVLADCSPGRVFHGYLNGGSTK